MNTHLLKAKRYLSCLLFLTLLLAWQSGYAEDFHVLSFRSDITLNADGSFDVVEDILINYPKPRHGFIRVLPYRYLTLFGMEGEIADGHVANTYHCTPIREINVEDIAFSVEKGANDIEIKIGWGDILVQGDVRYRIHYKVYGAINFFSKHSEFSWNVNGNDWDTGFDTLAVTIHLPTNKLMPATDLKAATGKLGLSLNQTKKTVQPGLVKFEGTTKFEAHEGMTVSLRFPKGYLRNEPLPAKVIADQYFINQLRTQAALHENGMIAMDAYFVLDVVEVKSDLALKLPGKLGTKDGSSAGQHIPRYELTNCEIVLPSGTQKAKASLKASSNSTSPLEIVLKAENFPVVGRYSMHLQYNVWGAAFREGMGSSFIPPLLMHQDNAPILSSFTSVTWDFDQDLATENVRLLADMPASVKVGLQGRALQVDVPISMSAADQVELLCHWPALASNFDPAPQHVASASFYYPFYHVDLDLKADGWIQVSNRFALHREIETGPFRRPLMLERVLWSWDEGVFGSPNYWGQKGNYLMDNLQGDVVLSRNGINRSHALEINLGPLKNGIATDTITYSYAIAGFYRDSSDQLWLSMPLIEAVEDPIDLVTATIHLPEGTLSPEQLQFITSYVEFYNGDSLPCKPIVQVGAGRIDMQLPCGMASNMKMRVFLGLPKNMVQPSLSLNFRLLLANHRAIFFPIFFFIPLFLLWFFVGRDKRFSKVVEFYPPEDITPAEAGLLIDEKLNNRDLLSLIYYWGAQGLIAIKEVQNEQGAVIDYSLEKFKPLGPDARKYEKIMFAALFETENPTKISAHSQKFYGTMTSTRAAFDAHVKSKNFYVPRSHAWAKAMRYIGWIMTGVALLSLSMVIGGFNHYFVDRFEIPLAWGLIAGMFLFFGRIMPKFGSFGSSQYQKLVGFQEFVLRAEKDKLKELVNTNPEYFGMTLPYAIALGIATQWVDRFEGLTISSPSYYTTGDPTQRNLLQDRTFATLLNRQLDSIADSLNSAPVSSGSSSSGSDFSGYSSYSSSSSSSRSYSSSSSSGSSSFRSGGGSSGSGYGGGGGRSW